MCPQRATSNGVDSLEARPGPPQVPTPSTGNIAGQEKAVCTSVKEIGTGKAAENIPNRAARARKSKGTTCSCTKPHADPSGRAGELPASVMENNGKLSSEGNEEAHAPSHPPQSQRDDSPGPSRATLQLREESDGDDSSVPSPPEDDPALTGPLMLEKDGNVDSVFLKGLMGQLESLQQERDDGSPVRGSERDSD